MHLKKKFLLAFLISVISIPIFESAFHHIFHHSHVECTETKIHFHDSKDFCSTCEYNFSTFGYEFLSLAILIPFLFSVLNFFYKNYLYQSFLIFYNLRAPPSFF